MRKNAANISKLRFMMVRFAADARAATAIEYGIIAAGVGAAIAATVWSLGSAIEDTLYSKINNALK